MPSPDIGAGTLLSVYVSGITTTAQENPASDDLPSIWDCRRTHQTQLGVLQRSVQRPKLTPADRWLWAWLCAVWNDWQ